MFEFIETLERILKMEINLPRPVFNQEFWEKYYVGMLLNHCLEEADYDFDIATELAMDKARELAAKVCRATQN